MKKYETPKIVQPGSSRFYLWLLFGLLLALALVVGWRGFDVGREQAGDTLRDLRSENAGQRKQISDLEQQRDRLKERLAGLERSNQVDREAVRQVREQLRVQQEERSRMEQELTFLRGMVSTKDERDSIRIQKFKLRSANAPGKYYFSFTLTRVVDNDGVANGSIFFAVDGMQNGEPRWLPLRELTESKNETLKMKFNNFQDVEGLVRLPEAFKPRRVIVEIKPSNKKLPEVKKHFDWVVSG